MHPFHLLWSVVINFNPLLSILVHFIQSYPFFCNFDPLSSIWSISYIFIQVLKSKNHHELCGLRKQLALHWISCVSVQTSESGDEWNLKRIGLCRVWMDLWVSKSSISQWDECSLKSSNYIHPIESRESSALPLQTRVSPNVFESPQTTFIPYWFIECIEFIELRVERAVLSLSRPESLSPSDTSSAQSLPTSSWDPTRSVSPNVHRGQVEFSLDIHRGQVEVQQGELSLNCDEVEDSSY